MPPADKKDPGLVEFGGKTHAQQRAQRDQAEAEGRRCVDKSDAKACLAAGSYWFFIADPRDEARAKMYWLRGCRPPDPKTSEHEACRFYELHFPSPRSK